MGRSVALHPTRGSVLMELKLKDASPNCMAVDGYQLFVCSSSNRVDVYSRRDCSLVHSFQADSPPDADDAYGCEGIAVDEQYVYVAVTGKHKIKVFTKQGKLVREWGGFGGKNGEFSWPRGITVCPHAIYVSDCDKGFRRGPIQVFKKNGSTKHFLEFGGDSPAPPLAASWGLAVNGDELYVVDQELHRVVVYNNKTGAFVRLFACHGSEPGKLDAPVDIAIARGGVFVTDSGNNRISVFDLVGNFKYVIGEQGDKEGQLQNPSSTPLLSVTASGHLPCLTVMPPSLPQFAVFNATM